MYLKRTKSIPRPQFNGLISASRRTMPKIKTVLKTKSQRNDSCIGQYKAEKAAREAGEIGKTNSGKSDNRKAVDEHYKALQERQWAGGKRPSNKQNSGQPVPPKVISFSAGIFASVQTTAADTNQNSWQALLDGESDNTTRPIQSANIEAVESRSKQQQSSNAFAALDVETQDTVSQQAAMPLFKAAVL
jgi:hypothetical protein